MTNLLSSAPGVAPLPDASLNVPSGERVLQVLACIARAGQALNARDLAAQTGIPLSSLYRHIAMLKKWGLLQEHAHNGQAVQSGLYEPGPMAVQLAWGFDHHSCLMQQAREEMQQLLERSGESVGLLIYLHGQVICLDMLESPQALRCSFTRGSTGPTARGASAKALLASLPPAVLDAQLANQQLDDASAAELKQQLQEIARQGYAVSQDEVDIGVWGVSVPVMSATAKAEATLSLMAPTSRALPRSDELIRLTQAAAAKISQRLRIESRI
ncbi:MAG: IclR family transcriptional regulator [Burkholderiaceae bacterium]|nr:IclR family transcriptional regulator [Burkholderiaceae bacterium]